MSKKRLEILKGMLFLEQNDLKSFYEMAGFIKGYTHALKNQVCLNLDKRESADIIEFKNKKKD
jgi:hypothetical protein